MAKNQVTLDALIPREDFEVIDSPAVISKVQTVSIQDLSEQSFFYPKIRKPDFQRETNEWTDKHVLEFIRSFLDGDLIPSIILWDSGYYTFVIDGAHRLSALIAWVHDDYGDGPISRSFYENKMTQEQEKVADRTRSLINSEIGSYKDHQAASKNKTAYKDEIVRRANNLASLAIQLQWVSGGIEKAEESFFKINQQAAPIDKTEIELLKSRKKPNALAARAIIRSGTGHKYWSSFDIEMQQSIEEIAKNINNILFEPEFTTPIKTLDIPLAGKGYSSDALALIFDFINISNGFSEKENNVDDPDGTLTKTTLDNCYKIVSRISGNTPNSIGLHPAVYFYSDTGRYQKTAFLAFINLVKDKVDDTNFFKNFISIRSKFEYFLVTYKYFINQIVVKNGSGLKGYKKVQDLYEFVFSELNSSINYNFEDIILNPKFDFLKIINSTPVDTEERGKNSDFSKGVKSKVFIENAISSALKCSICGGYIHRNSISYDHVSPKRDGGQNNPENCQLVHPFCNTTIKN